MKAAEETDSQSEMSTDMIVVVSVGPQDPAKMVATEWFPT
jgi:hypothetical protein